MGWINAASLRGVQRLARRDPGRPHRHGTSSQDATQNNLPDLPAFLSLSSRVTVEPHR